MSNNYEPSERQRCCRYCLPYMGEKHNENLCIVDGMEDDKVRKVNKCHSALCLMPISEN